MSADKNIGYFGIHRRIANSLIILSAALSISSKITCAPSEDSDQPAQFSQGTLWAAKDPKSLQGASEDSHQPAQMYRLICVFADRTRSLVRNAVPRLLYVFDG